MTRRLAVLTAVLVAVLVLGVGAVFAAPPWSGGDADWHDQMHANNQMRAVHQQMPDELRAECDQMHARMGNMHRGERSRMGTHMPSMQPRAR